MKLTDYAKGSVICAEGEPLQDIVIIKNGSARTVINGRQFLFESGDMLGICDLSLGTYSCTYTATSDVILFTFPYKNLSALESLLEQKPDIAGLLVHSLCRQLSDLLQYKLSLMQESDRAYKLLIELYAKYEQLCKQYAFTPKKLSGISDARPFSELDLFDEWLHTYYTDIKSLSQPAFKGFFNGRPGISMGFIRKGAEDALQVLNTCGDYIRYLKDITPVFLNSEKHDMFGIVSELHLNSVNIKGADAAVEAQMLQLTELLSGMTCADHEFYQKRLGLYKQELSAKREAGAGTDAHETGGAGQSLKDSLNVILEYSGCSKELCSKFTRGVHDYTKLTERSGADDATAKLRRTLTTDFYEIYNNVLVKSLEDNALPTIVKMFLNFGYVDEKLAGDENAGYLFSVADSLKGDPDAGVYTVREWLQAIYNGQKEPSHNDFDEDYPAYIRSLKTDRKIDDKEETRLLADNKSKLRFELENVFPVTNKVTFGVISTYCPLFSSHNIQRKLDASLITPALLKEITDEIRAVDYSAYYRETIYADAALGSIKEAVHVEVMPDVILMPNVGIRGIMWQDIEGKKRASPARIFLPLFLQGDLKTLFIRLTGEFRWEICKRVQGVFWNDMSEPSLTAEYNDYLQFYKNNRDFSSELKEAIKTELLRSRNNYKTVFAANYTDWLLYESKGSSRLNKIARRLLLTYCPFPAEMREKLKINPQFAELLTQFNLKKHQRVQKLERLIQKVTSMGKKVPQELRDELEFANR